MKLRRLIVDPPCLWRATGPGLSALEPQDRALPDVGQDEDEGVVLALALELEGLAHERQKPGPSGVGRGNGDRDSLLRRLDGVLSGHQALEVGEEDVQLPVHSCDLCRDGRGRLDADRWIRSERLD